MSLDDLRVLDLSRLLPGAYCAQLLQAQGATVTKVEPKAGDPIRALPGGAAYFDALHQGQQVVTLDLRSPSGRQDFLARVLEADVLTLEFPATAGFLRTQAEDPKNATLLQEALYDVTGRRLTLAFAVGVALLVLAWHMPSDVVGGYLLATLWAALAFASLRAFDRDGSASLRVRGSAGRPRSGAMRTWSP